MGKVKCKVCGNEADGICTIKNIGVKPNKSRTCKAYVYDESKVKPRKDIRTIKVSYTELQELKAKRKAEMKAIRETLKKAPNQGTARQLGLVDDPSNIILPGDSNFSIPKTDVKHPLTGDLSRFVSTANITDGE